MRLWLLVLLKLQVSIELSIEFRVNKTGKCKLVAFEAAVVAVEHNHGKRFNEKLD